MTSLDYLLGEATNVFPIVVSLDLGRYIVTAGIMSLIIWAFWRAHFKSRKIQARAAKASDYRREILASLRTALIFSIVGFCMHLAGEGAWLTIYEDFNVRGPLYFAASLALMIVGHDAYFYWTHRAMHHPRLFRTFHRTHHKSKIPTPWTAYAFEAPEALVVVAFVPLWVAFVPMHDLAIFSFVTWQIVRNVMGHAGVEMFRCRAGPRACSSGSTPRRITTCTVRTRAAITVSISPGGIVGWAPSILSIRPGSPRSRRERARL